MKPQTRRLKSLAAGLLLLASISIRAQVNVTTWHNDLARTGANTQETALTTTNVNVNTFGRLFTVPVDGQVYAQPLYLSGVAIGGGTHNVLYVATEHDSVYAIDADSGTIYAQVSLIPAGGTTVSSSSDLNCGDINPEVGITGTPVIDPTRNILYVVSKAKVSGNVVQQLHALSVTTLAEDLNGPVEIDAEVAGTAPDGDGSTLTFNPVMENQRPGLALENGHVLIGWAAHCDNPPYHGWLISYNASTLAQEAVWNSTPDRESSTSTQTPAGGIWMAGAAPAVDANGDIWVTSGNGFWNGTRDFSDSVLKLGPPANNTFPLLDFFNPFDQGGTGDSDVGSAGLILFPTTSSGAQLVVQQGKQGTIYLMNRNNLGKNCTTQSPPCSGTDTQITEEIRSATPGVLTSPVYWNGNVYWQSYSNLFAWSVDPNSGLISSSPTSQSAQTFARTAGISLSANGTTNGILWLMHNTGELFAFDATNLANILWTSGDAPNGRDRIDSSVKFEPPTIVNGKVYYGTADEVVALGLLGGTAPPIAATPSFSPGGGTYTSAQAVALADTTAGAKIYYTINGTTPTTASTLYTGPITVSTSEKLEAIAVASGFTNSPVGSATYTIQQSSGTTATPTFSPAAGTYTAAQSVTIADATAGATIYYTTNGSAPTTSSTVYAGPITVGANETLEAIAVASGQAASGVATATYTINTGGSSGTAPVSFPSGFAGTTAFTLDGGATVAGSALQVTDGGNNEARAIWYSTPLNIQQFTTDFTFQITPAGPNSTDGMTFAIQNQGLTAHGGIGGALGYQGVTPSVAVKFDTFNNAGEGVNSTGFYTNGAAPTVPAIDLTPSGVNLHSGDIMDAHLTYDGTTLTLTLTDTATNATFTASQAINIPSTVGASTAFIGFTGGTGGTVSTQNILSWTYTPTFSGSGTPTPAATPTFTPAAGTYTGAQSVTISDTTSGATIYYTTNGTTPTTSSTAYTGAINVSASETLQAIAVASGSTSSAVGSATYTIQETPTATPTFSPAAGTYTAAQSVTIADATSGATIYYTTNGSAPTTSSTVYSGPISVSASETLEAIAVASGQSASAVATAAYTINTGGSSGTSPVSFPSGFAGTTAFTLDGGATVAGSALQVTDGGNNEARAIWYSTPLNIQQFTTDFTFQITPAGPNSTDGMTFAIQNQGLTAHGGIGGGLGYQGISPSVAVKFDTFNNAGEGVNSTGFYTNGASPTLPATDLTPSGVNLHSGDVMDAHLTYDGTTLTLTLTDTVTNAIFTASQAIDIPGTVGSGTAFIGFTGGTGGTVSTQNILSWTYTPTFSASSTTSATPAATPTFTLATGTYTGAQSVKIQDATSGATIYYTTDGTTPTSSSTAYTGAINVGASETLKAIAVAGGWKNSAVGSTTYTIQQVPTATPSFSPAAGTYTATQTVTISDTASGAKIYYTTNGSPPTTSSAVYTGPISVSASETLEAIAVASGETASTAATASYTINAASGGSSGGTGTAAVSYSSGFTSANLALVNGTTLAAGALELTDGGTYEARAAWYSTPVNVQAFTTDFTFQISPAAANATDGLTFTIQNKGLTAHGGMGGSLGYQGVTPSVAVKFDTFNNSGEGVNSTGFYTNGAAPTIPAIDLTPSGVNLHSGHVMHVHLTYDGTTLTLSLTDTVTNATFTASQAINIPSTVGANTAFVGFTAGTGGTVSTQEILTWTYQVN